MADDSRRAADSRPGDPAEGVRIIGAEEAAEAIERGDVAERRGGHLPRYGDRPARPPAGPKPALRFPLEPGGEAEAPSLRPAKGQRFDPRPAPAWDEPEPDEDEGDPWPSEATWGDAGSWDDDPSADVAAWTRGETGTQPVVEQGSAAEPGLSWADDFVGDDDPWDGSWDEPTGAVGRADDEVGPVAAATGDGDGAGSGAVDEEEADDAWAAFGSADDEPAGAWADEPGPGPSSSGDAVDGAEVIEPTEHVPVLDPSWSDADPGAADVVADEADEADAGAAEPDDAQAGPVDADATEDDADAPDDGAWGEPSWGAAAVEDEVGTSGSSPLFDADGGWADDDEKVFDFADEPSGQVALPHWTEPGTGELPKVLADADAEPGSGEPTSGAHWRGHEGAWSDDAFDDLTDISDDVRVGAMDPDRPHDDEIYAFDEIDDMVAGDEPEPVPGRAERRLAPARPTPEPAAPSGGGAGRNIGVAVVVGVGLAAAALGLLHLGPGYAMILVVAALVVGVGEFQAAVQRAGYRPSTLFGLAFTALTPVAVFWKGIEAYPLVLVLAVVSALAWHLVGADGDARVVESVGVTLFGVAWVGGLGSFAALLLTQPRGTGVGMFVTAVLAAVGYDVGGLLIGRTMGTKPLSDASPNKTVEGLVGGVFISLFVTTVVVGMIGIGPWNNPGDAFKIGLLAALVAPLGDLCESLVKRDLGIKDMGNLLPEHGGVLDRFDTLLFVLPTVYYAAVLFHILPS